MATLTVRGIPERVYRRLRERAERNHRSINREIVSLLEETLTSGVVDIDAMIEQAHRAHERLGSELPDLIAEGKREGRRHEGDRVSDNANRVGR